MWNADLIQVLEIWPEANDIDVVTLQNLMDVAYEVCFAYAPTLPIETPVPESWKLAEIMQARHIWGQLRGGNQQEFGSDGLSIAVYPLIFAARDLIRPKSSPLGRLR